MANDYSSSVTRSGAGTGKGAHDGIDLFALINTVLRRRALIVTVAVIGALFGIAIALLLPRAYVARARLFPEVKQPAGAGLAGLAAQLGISTMNASGGQSPAFYSDLVESRAILGRIATDSFAVGSATSDRAALPDLLAIPEGAATLRREEAIKKLDKMVSANLTAKTGVITISVRARSPQLAAGLAERIIEELERFNVETRRTQAANERRFAAERLSQVNGEVREAENALQSFLQRNRDYSQSPALSFERDRLARQVSLKAETQTTLAQALEQARIEEVRDTPVLTVVEAPEIPPVAESRRLVGRAILGLAFGAFLGILIAFMVDTARSASYEAESFEEFSRLRRETIADIRHPLRAFRRIARPATAAPAYSTSLERPSERRHEDSLSS